MLNNLERLKVALEEWLICNGLDKDTHFYNIDRWRTRQEEYLNDAELVLVFEGNLHTILNDGGDTEEFEEYVESFGYYYEQGHSWNMGFYQIPNYDYRQVTGSYSQKLKDERWKKKAKLVKKKAGWKCQDCGSTANLETHHCYYTSIRSGHEPWEYPLSALRCLCQECHQSRAKSESRIRSYLAILTTTQIDSLRSGLDRAFYWFDSDAVIELLSDLGHSDEKIHLAITKLLKRRNKID